jgi:hypothetical protein
MTLKGTEPNRRFPAQRDKDNHMKKTETRDEFD